MTKRKGDRRVHLQIQYRRRRTGKVWHCCINCSHWPLSAYEATTVKPANARVCRVCSEKRDVLECMAHLVRPKPGHGRGR